MFISFKPGINESSALIKLESCIESVRTWMASNYLKLNDDKSEFVIFGSPHNLAKVTTSAVKIGSHHITSSKVVRNIGAMFDSGLKMDSQVSSVSKSAWYHLYQISKIRQHLTTEQSKCAIHAYVTSRLDQNNSLLAGIPSYLLAKLQRIQNAAAKVISRGKKRDHVTPILKELHWLPVYERIIFKTVLLVFKTLNGIGPAYLQDIVCVYQPARSLRSSSTLLLSVPKTRSVSYGDCSFSSFAPKMWNSLPVEIRSCKTVSSFKTSLKTYLFKLAYNLSS